MARNKQKIKSPAGRMLAKLKAIGAYKKQNKKPGVLGQVGLWVSTGRSGLGVEFFAEIADFNKVMQCPFRAVRRAPAVHQVGKGPIQSFVHRLRFFVICHCQHPFDKKVNNSIDIIAESQGKSRKI